MKAFEFNNKQTAALDQIKSYLSDIGKINCSNDVLTQLIVKFIQRDYARLDLLAHLDPDTMFEFAEWLSEQEI